MLASPCSSAEPPAAMGSNLKTRRVTAIGAGLAAIKTDAARKTALSKSISASTPIMGGIPSPIASLGPSPPASPDTQTQSLNQSRIHDQSQNQSWVQYQNQIQAQSASATATVKPIISRPSLSISVSSPMPSSVSSLSSVSSTASSDAYYYPTNQQQPLSIHYHHNHHHQPHYSLKIKPSPPPRRATGGSLTSLSVVSPKAGCYVPRIDTQTARQISHSRLDDSDVYCHCFPVGGIGSVVGVDPRTTHL